MVPPYWQALGTSNAFGHLLGPTYLPLATTREGGKSCEIYAETNLSTLSHVGPKSATGAMGKYQVRLYRRDDVRVGKLGRVNVINGRRSC